MAAVRCAGRRCSPRRSENGREHVFQFRTHLFGAGVTIDAIEFNDDQSEGYCFKVVGDEEEDLFELLARLVDLPLLEDVELGSSAKGPSVHAVAGSFPDDGVVSPEALV